MKLDRTRLERAAAAVESDLRRTANDGWRCTVVSDRTVTLEHDGQSAGSVVLDLEDLDTNWYTPPNASSSEVESGITFAALDVVVDGVLYLLEERGMQWPDCPEHPRRLRQCAGAWLCESRPPHSIEIGALEGPTGCSGADPSHG